MKRIVAVILGAVLVALSPMAQADTISYSDSVSLVNDTDGTITLNQFDSSLGTLTHVYLYLTNSLSGVTIELDNDALIAQTGTARVGNTISNLTSSVALTPFAELALIVAGSQEFNLASNAPGDTIGEFNATGLGDYGIWQPGGLTSSSSGEISEWTGYVGPGTFDISMNSAFYTTATFNGSDGYFQGNTPNATFSGAVVYEYIPEPASAAMIGLVGLASFWIRRRFAA